MKLPDLMAGSDVEGTTIGPGMGQERDARLDAEAARVTAQPDPVDEIAGSISTAQASADVDAAIAAGRHQWWCSRGGGDPATCSVCTLTAQRPGPLAEPT